ncbi:hypothetical protein EYF80_037807 [Liparis tanakae]|uniref:Uncharacterized protein n=1 Tax=Liparis tanakae TaxID=230148 RepID=A0A4Z2GFI7_9TELE|nr:hypothetical protein EYF80_037807 [Liparis tanakae]
MEAADVRGGGQILSRVEQVRLPLQLQLAVEELDLRVGLGEVLLDEVFHVWRGRCKASTVITDGTGSELRMSTY